MVRTYIENQNLSILPDEYSEESLSKKFADRDAAIRRQIAENLQDYRDLRNDEAMENFQEDSEDEYSKIKLNNALRIIRTETEKLRKEGEEIYLEHQLLNQYGNAFSKLYYVKDLHEKAGEVEKISFKEVDVTDSSNYDTLTDGQYFGAIADPEGKIKQLALEVTEDDMVFNLGMTEFHKPNSAPEVKMQISFEEEDALNLTAEKVKKIIEFCEKHGISYEDMIVRRFDGSIDESEVQSKLDRVIEEAKILREQEAQQKDNELLATEEARASEIDKVVQDLKASGEISEDADWKEVISSAEPLDSEKGLATETDTINNDLLGTEKAAVAKEQIETSANSAQQVQQNAPQQQSVSAPQEEKENLISKVRTALKRNDTEQNKCEKQFEEFFEQGLAKKRGFSYFKSRTLSGWTEYVIYDTEDWLNRINDGKKEKGTARYNYNFKFFMREGVDGQMDFAIRTPHNKKLDEVVINGIASQLKSLGFTHVNFPKGVSDAEKALWRKALAEQGLVPIGIGIDRSKANGMIKAATEKLSDEKLSTFKYRLALQMNENAKKKNKKLDTSEQEFIDNLIKAHQMEGFTNGYSNYLKSYITKIIHPEHENPNGAVDKIGAMINLRRLFDIFKDGVEAGSILASPVLKDAEKAKLRSAGLTSVSPDMMSGEDVFKIYQILMPYSKQQAKFRLDVKFREPGVKRAHEVIKQGVFNSVYNNCKSIIKELKALGAPEIDLPETTNELPFVPPMPQQQQTPAPRTQPQTHSSLNGNSGVGSNAMGREAR